LRNAQRFQHSPNCHATGTVNGINSDRKILCCNELAIDIRQVEDLLDVIIQCLSIRLHRTYLVIFFILIALLLAYSDNFLTFFSIKKLTFTIEQLQCIPFRGIMAGRDDDGPVGLMFKYGHGYRRRGGYAHLNHIATYRLQRGRYNVLAYLAGYAGVAAHDDCTILCPASKS